MGSVIHKLIVGRGGRDEVLIVVDQVIELPEGFGVLHVCTAAGEGGGAGPGMEALQGKVLEDDLNLRIVGQDAAKGVVQSAADWALEIRILD